MTNVRSLPPALALALILSLSAFGADRPPNIVMINADDLGYADIGCFGAKGYKTPNIDRLASQGRRFTNFHVSQPVCSASRTALLTGCYSNRIGIHGALGPQAKIGISAEETTIAEMLKSKNYATGMAGKWHLGHLPRFLPVRHGFDEYLGLPYSNDMWPHHPGAKKGTYPNLPLIENDKIIDPDVEAEDQKLLTQRYTDRAVDFIARNKNRPFFFYLAYAMPHVPLFTGEKYRGKSGAGEYADVVSEIDGSVGEIMNALDANGLTNDTLVVFTSDNGPWLAYGDHAGSAGPLREGKGTCWEGGVRVPCVMRWPGRLPVGTSSDAMLMTIDLLPTIAGIVGAKLTRPVDGRDVLPLLKGEPGAKNPHEAYLFYYGVGQLQAVTSGDGRWKLQLPHNYTTLDGGKGGTGGKPVKYASKQILKPELYDLRNDIGESKDVAATHPEVVQTLMKFVEAAREDLGDSLVNRVGNGTRRPGQAD